MADGGRQLLPREERRAQLLRAAAMAFADGGYSATSMDDVARAAGITKLIVYRHFESKADLYRAILDEVATELGHAWQAADRADHIEGGATRVLLTVARRHPDGFRLLFVHAAREPEFQQYRSELRELQVAAAGALVRPVVADPAYGDWATEVAVDILEAMVLRWLEHGDPERDEEFADLATRTVAAMVGAVARSDRTDAARS